MTADKELAATLDALGFGEAASERRAAQTEAAQVTRWGRAGLDMLTVPASYMAPEQRTATERACEGCGGPLPPGGPGRPRRFCSDACRQRAHRAGVGRARRGHRTLRRAKGRARVS